MDNNKLMENKLILIPMTVEELMNRFQQVVDKALLERENSILQEKLLSPSETCKLFEPNISKVTLNKWEKGGRIKAYRLGGRVYFRYSEIMDSLKTLKKYQKSI